MRCHGVKNGKVQGLDRGCLGSSEKVHFERSHFLYVGIKKASKSGIALEYWCCGWWVVGLVSGSMISL